MVNAIRGVLLECDPAVKQFILHLNKENTGSHSGFVIMDLDETHLFVDESIVEYLQEKLDDLHEKSYQFKKT
ncbi:TFIIH basal transcription factor complex TTD-A subunit [Acrasis kona]|uniref:General transcription and DNA repair factor IIH subunit TFB5 n=1 Tax=Acrasis kona TaxID=1008807 RepID=A0AAW2Z1N7_9EUKA